MKLDKQVYSLVLIALFTNVVNLNSQVSVPTTPSSVGQAKADLIKSAFSSYLSGDTNQSRQYLMRASELDVEDVTVRRLLQSLTPSVSAVQPLPLAPSPPAPVTLPPATSLTSASDQARIIALNNGLTPAQIDAARQLPSAPVPSPIPSPPSPLPSVPDTDWTSVSTLPSNPPNLARPIPPPPPLQAPVSSQGKLDFSGFQESYTPPPSNLGSSSPSPNLLSSSSSALTPISNPSSVSPVSGTIEQQLSAKRANLDNLIAQISQTTIALNQAQTSGDIASVQARESELSILRAQVGTIDSEVVELQQQLSSGSLAPSNSTSSIPRGTRTDLILSGETIELLVMQDESFNGMYQVRQGGYILIPQVGRVPVSGMTVPAAEESVAKAFSQTMIVNPTVIIERPEASKQEEDSGGVIYLMGDFKRPGTFRMQRGRPTTILNTIIQSGGETPGADLSRVRLMRLVNGRNLVEEINVNEILKGGGLANDMMLRDGDILHIPSRPDQPTDSVSPSGMRGASSLVEDPAKPTRGRDNGVFVTGRVKSAGFVELSENVGLTAYAAILAKGGFAPFANIKKVFVVREVGGGQKVHIPVNIRNVQHGLEPDIELRVEDIIVVPEKFFSL